MPDAAPPITPSTEDPKLESRESIKDGVASDLIEARRAVRDGRMKAIEAEAAGGYSRSEANGFYLAALQNLVTELWPTYERLGICEEYWEPEVGDPLAMFTTPQINPTDLFGDDPGYRKGHPQILTPKALESQFLGTIRCLPDLLQLEDAKIPFTVSVKVRGVDGTETRRQSDYVVIDRPTLDRARQWCLGFADRAGISLETNDERTRGRMGGEVGYGDD